MLASILHHNKSLKGILVETNMIKYVWLQASNIFHISSDTLKEWGRKVNKKRNNEQGIKASLEKDDINSMVRWRNGETDLKMEKLCYNVMVLWRESILVGSTCNN